MKDNNDITLKYYSIKAPEDVHKKILEMTNDDNSTWIAPIFSYTDSIRDKDILRNLYASCVQEDCQEDYGCGTEEQEFENYDNICDTLCNLEQSFGYRWYDNCIDEESKDTNIKNGKKVWSFVHDLINRDDINGEQTLKIKVGNFEKSVENIIAGLCIILK